MKLYLWKLFLRVARSITLTVDDWIQRQEVLLRDPAQKAKFAAEVDPVTSAAREKTHKRAARVQKSRPARLRYQGGQFVRQEGVSA
jgi:hypothetical protein